MLYASKGAGTAAQQGLGTGRTCRVSYKDYREAVRQCQVNPNGIHLKRFNYYPISTDLEGGLMAITYQKRQKEMKRLEKRRQKAERREQRKLAQREQKESPAEYILPLGDEIVIEIEPVHPESS